MIDLSKIAIDLPIREKLDQFLKVLESGSRAVLVAPPGAGKTTIIPLALLDAPWRQDRKIIVLEPRRLAARNAAMRMASLLGETVGETVGYRVRLDTKISKATRIEVVTEGVFTQMLSSDPGLEDVACVLFDEFHERSLDSDLALALCLDLQSGLREDLRLVPMSATLDGGHVAKVIDAPIIESRGRQFPVEIVYQEGKPRDQVETTLAQAVRAELQRIETQSILCFLPGQREIERTYDKLSGTLPDDVSLHRLYGMLSPAEQDAAIRSDPEGARKVVLSSAIAETSLTIEGITTVIDSGFSRQPVYEPSTGMTRLQTVRSDQASIQQRAGRAGRLGPGRAVRLWREQQTAALPKEAIPEILNADLTALVLDLADWGVSDPEQLVWLDPPPKPAWKEALSLLERLGALKNGTLTDHGKAIASLPLPPRLAHMVVKAHNRERAVLLALILQERGAGGRALDLDSRMQRLQTSVDRRTKQLKALSRRIARMADKVPSPPMRFESSNGSTLAQAFPDRVAQRSGQIPNGMVRFLLANGRSAEMDAAEQLASSAYIVVADMLGRAGSARIVSAVSLEKTDLLEIFNDQIETVRTTRFDQSKGSLLGEEARCFGALKLEKPRRFEPDSRDIEKALVEVVRKRGLNCLPWQKSDQAVLARLRFFQSHSRANPCNLTDEALLSDLEEWLQPFLSGRTSLNTLDDGTLSQALLMRCGLSSTRELEGHLPTHFVAPTGSKIPIDYTDDKAVISVRPQEMFGLDQHPSIINNTLRLELELVSPAGRPIQITKDLPGFWRGSWADVRADLRGRYPKHPWPENPLEEPPTARTKPRKA